MEIELSDNFRYSLIIEEERINNLLNAIFFVVKSSDTRWASHQK